jgi:Zn-dependent peptidase ImmA (M78 family)
MLTNLAYKRIETLANELIAKSEISHPPVPVDKIIEGYNITIKEFDFEDDISGVLVIAEDGATIGVNPKDNNTRMRFALAHELGHFLLHKDTSEVFIDKDFIVKWRNVESNSNYTVEEVNQEMEANAFAAALLMPKNLIEQEMAMQDMVQLGENALLEQLATRFVVSVPAIAFRITNINSYYV